MDFDHAPLCEEPSALSGNEVSFAFLMSDSAEEIADAQIPDDSLDKRPSKQPKTLQKRFRMEWKQKAIAIKHYESRVPKMTHRELADWCKTTFKFDQAPAESTVASWFHEETKAGLLFRLENEHSGYVRQQKSLYPVRFRELEEKLGQWFHSMENRKAILSDHLIQKQALKFATELKLDKFTASKGWLQKCFISKTVD